MEPSQQPFPDAVHDLARTRGYKKRNGTVNYRPLADELPTIQYEVLRKITSGVYPPSKEQLAEIASVLREDPSYFAEYRAMVAAEQLAREVAPWLDWIMRPRQAPEQRPGEERRSRPVWPAPSL